jgi:hypothetical protein
LDLKITHNNFILTKMTALIVFSFILFGLLFSLSITILFVSNYMILNRILAYNIANTYFQNEEISKNIETLLDKYRIRIDNINDDETN